MTTTERPPSASSAAMAPPPAPLPTTTTSQSTTRSRLPSLPATRPARTSSNVASMTTQPLGAYMVDVRFDGVAESATDARIGVIGEQAQPFDRLDEVAADAPTRVHPAVDVAAAPRQRH